MNRVMLLVIFFVASVGTSCNYQPLTGQQYQTTQSIPLNIITNSDINSLVNRARWRVAIFNSQGGISGWQDLASQSNETTFMIGGDGKQYYNYSSSGTIQSTGSWTNANTGYAEGCSGSWCPKHAVIRAELIGNDGYVQSTYSFDEDALGCMYQKFFTVEAGYAVMGQCSNGTMSDIVIYATN